MSITSSAIKKPCWGVRHIKTGKQHTVELVIAGIPARVMWTPLFDRRGDGSRAVASISFDTKTFHYGLLFQHYREGYDFDDHFDGVPENKVITILLHRPLEGGEFFIEGPEKSYLKGRLRTFDGGRYIHGVTKITKGSRTVLMLQRGRWKMKR